MAQPTMFRLQYLGAVLVKKGVEYSALGFLSNPKFATANLFMMKTEGVSVSVNKTVQFESLF